MTRLEQLCGIGLSQNSLACIIIIQQIDDSDHNMVNTE